MLDDETQRNARQGEAARLEAREEPQRGETPLNATVNPGAIPPDATQKGNGLSIASLVLGILTVLPGPVLAIMATIFGGATLLCTCCQLRF